jgi:hypothetical protein
MNRIKLMTLIHESGLTQDQAMTLFQDAGLISDNCMWFGDVYKGDLAACMVWIENYDNGKTETVME